MKVATVQKTFAAVAVSLVFVLTGFTVGLAHSTAPSGLLVTIQLQQVFPGHPQLDHHMPFGFGAEIYGLPSPSQSPVYAARARVALGLVFTQIRAATPAQPCSAISRLFDTVLLI
jgi:hypothetical protein